MKRTLVVLAFLASGFCVSQAQLATDATRLGPAAPFISDRGAHHRTWSRLAYTTNRQGQVSVTTNTAYLELATALHYRDPITGNWTESDPRFEITPQGYAVARRGQHQVILAPNIAATNAVDMQMPDGRRMTSHPWGLAFHDRASGSNVLIAVLKNCAGQLISSNVVFYPDAFDGLKAAVRYTYTRHGFEQDIVLYENPGSPANWGLDPATTALETWTEVFAAPTPQLAMTSTADGDEDQRVDFPAMALGEGKAYFLSLANHDEPSLPVRKVWQRINGRTFLIEAVRYTTSSSLLNRLVAVPQDAESEFARRAVASREALLAQSTSDAVSETKLLASITPGRMNVC